MEPRTPDVLSIQKAWNDNEDGFDQEGTEEIEKTEYWENDHTLVYKVEVMLEPGKAYGITLPADYIRSAKGLPMKKNYELIFKIR